MTSSTGVRLPTFSSLCIANLEACTQHPLANLPLDGNRQVANASSAHHHPHSESPIFASNCSLLTCDFFHLSLSKP